MKNISELLESNPEWLIILIIIVGILLLVAWYMPQIFQPLGGKRLSKEEREKLRQELLASGLFKEKKPWYKR